MYFTFHQLKITFISNCSWAINSCNFIWFFQNIDTEYHVILILFITQGPDCCSDDSTTFHYIAPHDMYVLEFLIYHLRPYGIIRDYKEMTQILSQQSLRKKLVQKKYKKLLKNWFYPWIWSWFILSVLFLYSFLICYTHIHIYIELAVVVCSCLSCL